MVKWPAADEKSEQVVLVDSHMEKKSLQGKEDENEFEQCLLHLFHDNSVQIHKYSQRQLFWELRVVLLNQQRAVSWVFFPFTIAPCNIGSAWHLSVEQPPLQQWGRKRLYQALQERIKKSNWAFSQVLGFISISGKEKVSVWAMERFLRFLLSWYSDIIVEFLQYWFPVLHLEYETPTCTRSYRKLFLLQKICKWVSQCSKPGVLGVEGREWSEWAVALLYHF